jgi:hypothetical protein
VPAIHKQQHGHIVDLSTVKLPRCMLNQPLAYGRKRKIDKLTAWENQHPKQRATSGHEARLESRRAPGTYIV